MKELPVMDNFQHFEKPI